MACRKLGIENLRFHDLRHEATSRLFERGYEIHEVQQFTLHSSSQHLLRYTHLRPERIPELPYSYPSTLSTDPQAPIDGDSLTGKYMAGMNGA